jgi:ribonuclease D
MIDKKESLPYDYTCFRAQMAELVDAQVSGTCGATRGSSSLLLGTTLRPFRGFGWQATLCGLGQLREKLMTITLHQNDLPSGLSFGDSVAVDCEMMGLNPNRDRLCLVQLSAGDGNAHLVRFEAGKYDAPNLKKILGDPKILKIFHFGRIDIGFLWKNLGVLTAPVYCTKMASRLARTYTEHHSLKTICKELLGVELDKQQTSTDWGAAALTQDQVSYAASDVLHLHRLKKTLDDMLAREGRTALAQACFDFLPHRALLDDAGWAEGDIFAHH